MCETGSVRRGQSIIDWSVPLAILLPSRHAAVGYAMERGLIRTSTSAPCRPDSRDFRPGHRAAGNHQIFFGANPIQTPAPDGFSGSFDFGRVLGYAETAIIYPIWRLVYFCFRLASSARCSRSCNSPPSAWWYRAGMADRETVGFWASTSTSALPHVWHRRSSGRLAGVMYGPINSPNYHMGMDFLV